MAILTSFLEWMSACLAEFLSKPIDTSIEIASSGGSGVDETGAGKFPSIWRPAKIGTFPGAFLAGAEGGGRLPVDGQESRAKKDVINSGNFTLLIRKKFKRYKQPAIIPQSPGTIDLFQDEKRSWRPAK